MKQSKRNKELSEKIDVTQEYNLDDAVNLLKENSKVKFVESLDCAVKLGVDPRHADQMVRGTVSFPDGTGKTGKVLVIALVSKREDAQEAGADSAGFEET